jgi:uncharacterized RDD family membrane protein YckC
MADWKPCRKARGGAVSGGAGGPEAVCAECGKVFPVDETIRYGEVRVCAACKPVFLQKLQEGALLSTSEMRYAGFWIRVAAKIIDGLIIGVPLMIIFVIVMFFFMGTGPSSRENVLPGIITPLLQIAFLGVQMGYEIFFLGKYGATPGKMACSIKVVTADGGKIGYGRATGRFFSYLLSGIICYIGYIIVAFDGQKRALHDYICNTRVVYK